MHHHKPVFPSREVGPVYKPAQSDDAIDNTPRQAGPAENLHSADFVGCVLADAILDDFVGQGQYSIQNGEHRNMSTTTGGKTQACILIKGSAIP